MKDDEWSNLLILFIATKPSFEACLTYKFSQICCLGHPSCLSARRHITLSASPYVHGRNGCSCTEHCERGISSRSAARSRNHSQLYTAVYLTALRGNSYFHALFTICHAWNRIHDMLDFDTNYRFNLRCAQTAAHSYPVMSQNKA